MATQEDKGRVKMTVIHFETESNNQTLQENIRAIANTLSRALVATPRPIARPAQLSQGNGTAAAEHTAGEEAIMEEFEDVIDAEATSVPAKSKTKPPVLRTPQPLDLDLISGDVPLKAFLEQKNPTTDLKRYLAIAYWLKEYRRINEITMDHAYTCYRFMGSGWSVPKDASAPFRKMKGKDYGWMNKGTAPGSFVINHLGENEVNKMAGE